MKRLELIRHLQRHGSELLREGAKHFVYVIRDKGKSSTVPRHREISDLLARKVCRDHQIPEP